MKLNLLGTSGIKVSEICLGTMTFGEQNSEQEAHAQLDAAVAQGINFIDVAEMYPVPVRAETFGRTEQFVGSWLKTQPREQIVLATKVAGPPRLAGHLGYVRGALTPLSAADIERGVEGSLARLGTDYLDLYQVHWPARNVPMFGGQFYDAALEHEAVAIEVTLAALDRCVKAGKIRAIGLSNETPWGMQRWLNAAALQGHARVASVQNAYSLLNRLYETTHAEVSLREQLPLLAYSPLAFGCLTGKHMSGADPQSRLKFEGFAQRYSKVNVAPAVAAYAALAHSRGLTPTQLALAFVRAKPFVASTIIGATSLPQLQENIAAFAVTLDAETLAAIDQLHLRFSNPAP